MLQKLEKLLMPIAKKIGDNKYLMSIRDGFLVSTPLLIVGSFFLLLNNLPIPGYGDFMASIFGPNFGAFITKPVNATFDMMALIAAVGIGYSFATRMNVDKIFGAVSSLVGWFILMPLQISVSADITASGVAESVKGIPFLWVGSRGIFAAMLCAFLAVHIFSFVSKKGWVIKMPEGVPPTVVNSFAALIPIAMVMTTFCAINVIFALTPYGSAFDLIYQILQVPLLNLGNTLGAMITAYIFLHFFWFFGINGSAVVGAIFNPILHTLSAENLAAYNAGTEIPNIISGSFQDMFATFGGAGSTLSLIIAMILICRSKRIKQLGKLSLIPGIFGINEPIIFGLPIMLNPMMLIPFMLVPTINIIISYFAMFLGFVPYTNGIMLPWTTPIIFSGFLVTNWAGAVLQVLLLVLGVFIYMPFIKVMDKQYLEEELEAANKVDDEDMDLSDLSFDDL